MANNIKSKTIKGFIWRFSERICAQLVSFVVSVILARILLLEDYGVVVIVNVFISIANVLVSSGFGTSLIQKKDADELDFNTMFHFSFFLAIFLYLILFFSAPLVAKLFTSDLIIPVLRVMGIRLPISAISSIQHAIVSRKMNFKHFFFATIIGTVISAIIGITLAYKGYGVWALVAQNLTNITIDTIVLSITLKWWPKFIFSWKRFKELFSYSSQILFASLLGTLCDKLKSLIIGGKYSKTDLSFYNKGENIPTLITDNINSSLDTVLFPALSKFQDDINQIKNAVRKSIRLGCFITFPLMFGLGTVADKVILVLLTEKWAGSIIFVRILCFQCLWGIINSINVQAIKAVGRSDIILKLEFIKKPLFLLIIILCAFINPLAIAIGSAVYSFLVFFINSFPNKKLLNYSFFEQIKDISLYLFFCIIMSFFIFLIGLININIYLSLFLQIIAGIFIYVGLSLLFKCDDFFYLINLIKGEKSEEQ